MMEETIKLKAPELFVLIERKFKQAGLPDEQAKEAANQLVFADACGIHSHGVVRLDYYAEQITKGGITIHPETKFEQTGPSTAIFHGDNGMGQFICRQALEHGFKMVAESGLALVGVSKMSHSGALGYYLKKAAEKGYIALSMCQSDPMVVPFGGSEIYFGTNPIGIGAPCADRPPVVFDMATSVQAWGKILDARSKKQKIPTTWAVDKDGKPTDDPMKVQGLLPIAGPKGYGLMMMVDILAGVLLGLPFGKHVSSMYDDLTTGRNLGQIFLLIDPKRFTDPHEFKIKIKQMVDELHENKPADGFDQVYYPGELSQIKYETSIEGGIEIPTSIYEYLQSETVHFNQYNGKDAFAE